MAKSKYLFPEMDKTTMAIERLKLFEPKEGYHLAFSGGKDSQVIYRLAEMSGVKFDAHYQVTTVDPPELMQFMRRKYPDVKFELPELTMWELIPKKRMPPTQLVRYCCEYLKERGGEGRFVVTGIRALESPKRMNSRRMMENCHPKQKQVLNPIIDWNINDVWDFTNKGIGYHCKLYDEGWDRIGCIGCPMGNKKNMLMQFKRYPTIKNKYIKAFDEMIRVRKERGMKTTWKTAQEVFDWWVYRT